MSGAGWEVVIIGAGPVGLLLANLLGQAGIRTLVADKRHQGPDASMAIGITPPSLQILRELELDRNFVDCGIKVNRALIYGDRRRLGEHSFAALPGPWPYILAFPQATTVRLLETRLADWPSVELRRGWALASFSQEDQGVEICLEGPGGARHCQRAGYLVGCDGRSGMVRDQLEISRQSYDYPQNFLMADHADLTGLGNAAALFFTRSGSVESFPLPNRRRRWIIQTDRFESDPAPGLLETVIRQRTGIALATSDKSYESAFRVSRLLVERYFSGRVVLCGDAAHLMSPVGGQGMNVGFGDARRLATALAAILHRQAEPAAALSDYTRDRRPAAAVAIARAGRGMAFGTRRGRLACLWRGAAIKLLLSPLLRSKLPPYFAMLTLPGKIHTTPEGA